MNATNKKIDDHVAEIETHIVSTVNSRDLCTDNSIDDGDTVGYVTPPRQAEALEAKIDGKIAATKDDLTNTIDNIEIP